MSDSEALLQRRLESLLTVIDQAVFRLNVSGEVVEVSKGSFDWLKDQGVVGRTFTSLFAEDVTEHINTLIDQSLQTHDRQSLLLNMKPEHSLHWRELGLDSAQSWEMTTFAISATEVLVVIKDVSESKRLEQKVFHQAQRDPLTGAYNRRSLMTILQQSVAQAQRYDWVCSFLVIDIDNFSQINDQFGWDAGDKILQQFVTALHAFKRTADFFARYSDDRFVMFLPETNSEQALLAADRVRKLAAEQVIPYQSGDLTFTVSIGAATLKESSDTPESILKRAEEHLFIAKQSGNDRIEGEEF